MRAEECATGERGWAGMSESKSSAASGGIGLCGVVFAVFLALKLAEVGAVATWSWWWVTAPLWGPTALVVAGVLAFLVVKFVVMVVIAPIVDWANRRERLRRFDQ